MKQTQKLIKADTLWGKYRIDSAGDTVTPVLVKYIPTAFDSLKPCDIKLLAPGDTASAATIVGTIKPNICVGYEKTMSELCTDAADMVMFPLTVYVLVKLIVQVRLMPRFA